MGISPVQFAAVLAAGTAQPGQAPAASEPAPLAEPSQAAPSAAPAQNTAPTLSTNLRIDDRRRIYYEIINEKSGEVVLEIPPEQIRKLAEVLAESPASPAAGQRLDVKS